MAEAKQTKAEQLADHEIAWWKAHHREDEAKLFCEMAKVYHLLFNLPWGEAKVVVKTRVEAAQLHSKAEELEDEGKQEEADEYWAKAKEALRRHFELLEKYRRG